MKELIILIDHDGHFLLSIEDLENYTSMDVRKLERNFIDKGYSVSVKRISELDLSLDYQGKYILYTTSEVPGAFYKRYVEDVIFFLTKKGATTLPKFEYLKAHHNKVYMEMLRTTFGDEALKTIKSRCFGTANEAMIFQPGFPVVIKQADGSGSRGVYLAKNEDEYKQHVHSVSKSLFSEQGICTVVNLIFKNKIKQALDRNIDKIMQPIVDRPFVVQNYIKGLKGDYKVLIFGGKYYTLYRENRDNDFRASGSGKFFDVPEHEHKGLLEFSRKLKSEIDFPLVGLDVGFDGENYHLLEFQVIHLGPLALQRSNFWHEYNNDQWVRVEGKSDLEEEFARSIHDYIVLKEGS